MSTPHGHARARRSIWLTGVVGLVLSLASTWSIAPVQAATGEVRWACESDGIFGPTGLDMGLDTALPGVLHVGEATDVTTALAAALPAATAKQAYETAEIKARFVEATFTLQGAIGTQPVQQDLRLASTPIPAQSTRTAVSFSIVSAPVAYVPTAPGDVVVGAAVLAAQWTFRRADGSLAASIGSTCRPESGAPIAVDAVVVRSRSSTTLALGALTSVYGQVTSAAATATTTAGPVPGGVVFSIDGVGFRAPVDATGVASLILPGAPTGAHQVAATFLADDPAHHDTSTSAPQNWVVTKAGTKARVRVNAKRSRRGARLGISLTGAYDTVPTGSVAVTFKRLGKPGSRRGISRVLVQGHALTRVGRLRKGRYAVVVKYRGDANHQRTKKTKRFRVG